MFNKWFKKLGRYMCSLMGSVGSGSYSTKTEIETLPYTPDT